MLNIILSASPMAGDDIIAAVVETRVCMCEMYVCICVLVVVLMSVFVCV